MLHPTVPTLLARGRDTRGGTPTMYLPHYSDKMVATIDLMCHPSKHNSTCPLIVGGIKV